MRQFTKETQSIIDAHKNDFNCTNFNKIIKEKGGYNTYVKSLGGVFTKYIGKTPHVTTVKEFQEVAEYVFGLMAIWGFDYNNNQKYIRWGGGSPYYVNNKKGKCNKAKIDDMCSGKKSCTTNCNYGADALFYKCGLEGEKGQFNSCANWKSQINTYKGKIIRRKLDLKPGDIVHFFRNKCEGTNPNKWSGWGHVAVVGEVTDNTIIMYDAGSYCIRKGIHKREVNRKVGNVVESGWKDWVGVRLYNLIDTIPIDKNKTDSDLAIEVIKGIYGSGDVRKNNLGTRYNTVQKLVNEYLETSGRENYIRAAALYVLKGYAGKDQIRKDFFGNDYNEVQNKVNWTITTAKEVIKGKYGNGDTRRAALGEDYDLVQTQVNMLLK